MDSSNGRKFSRKRREIICAERLFALSFSLLLHLDFSDLCWHRENNLIIEYQPERHNKEASREKSCAQKGWKRPCSVRSMAA